MKTLIIPIIAVLSGATSAIAAVTAVSNVVLTSATDGQVGFTSFDVGGTTYNDLTIATVTGIGGQSVFWAGGSDGGPFVGNPANGDVAVEDAFITTGIFGTPELDFDFGLTLNSGGTELIYISENGSGDTITVNPIVGGTVDTSWSLLIQGNDTPGTDWGATGAPNPWSGNPNNEIHATTFSIADFSGGAGTLTNVTGISFDGNNDLDVSQVGVVPEPSVFALFLGFVGLGLVYVKRRIQ